MATARRTLVYRVRQIPTSIDQHHALVSLLINIAPDLGPHENIKVLSLTPGFETRENPQAKIATVKFRQLPARFNNDRSSWELNTATIGSSANILVDNGFLGFTVLNNISSEAHLLDCIAISGLGSHPFGSWTPRDSESDHMWLRDRLPQDFPEIRSVLYGYNTELLKSRSTQTVDDIAITLNHRLRAIAQTSRSAKPILFLAHSLGGIILKKAIVLLNASGKSGDRAILESTRQIIFFGVPNKGMQMSHLLPMVEGQPNNNLVQMLQPNSADLENLDAQFNDVMRTMNTRVISVYELKLSPTTIKLQNGTWSREGPLALLVNEASAKSAASLPEDVVCMDEDHSNMVKFADNDQNYQTVFPFISDLVNDLRGLSTEPPRRAGFVSDQNHDVERKLREAILGSLDNNERRWRYHQIDTAHSGTFDWIFEERIGFTDWLRDVNAQSGPIFWIRGKPGSGKSTLMKWIVQNGKTKFHLDSGGDGLWELVPFFFYEQGSAVQNTAEGLLQELLWKLLLLDARLVDLVLPIRAADLLGEGKAALEQIKSDAHAEQVKNWHSRNSDRLRKSWASHGERQSTESPVSNSNATRPSSREWSMDALEASILAIIRQGTVKANVCFFVDALDEHRGHYRRLTGLLQSLVDVGIQPNVHLKLCLASRIEPHFVHVFATCPGFAIHEHTNHDVRQFAADRLRSSMNESKPHQELEPIRQLVQEISQKAEGVFIWVKLVVDELCDCLEDGSTIEEAAQILRTLPTDLSEFYHRIILKTKEQYRHEAMIMFQLVLCEPYHTGPWSLNFLKLIVDFVSTGAIQSTPVTEFQSAQFIKRLQSRTGGLIEAISIGRGANATKVTFLHRTVKEFLQSSDYRAAHLQQLNVPEHGSVYLLKFYVYAHKYMKLEQMELFQDELCNLDFHYCDAETRIGQAADEIFDDLLGTALASEELKALLISVPSIELNENYDLDPEDLSIHERVLKGFYCGVNTSDMASTSKATLDGLHMADLTRIYGKSLWQLDFPKESFFVNELSSRPYTLLLKAARDGMMPYIRRKALSGHKMTMKSRPSVLHVLFDFYRKRIYDSGSSYDRYFPKMMQEERDDLEIFISEFKDCVREIIRNEPKLENHTPLGISGLRILTLNPGYETSEVQNIALQEICEFLLKLGFPCDDVLENYPGWHFKQREPLLTFFLKRGVSPNRNLESKYGFRLLLFAISKGSIHEARILLEHGADPHNVGHGVSIFHPQKCYTVKGDGWLAKRKLDDFVQLAQEMRSRLEVIIDDHVCISERQSTSV